MTNLYISNIDDWIIHRQFRNNNDVWLKAKHPIIVDKKYNKEIVNIKTGDTFKGVMITCKRTNVNYGCIIHF